MENNIAYCIPTYNHPDTVKEVIGLIADMYNRNGFDIYIYDTSETEETKNVIEQYCNQGITNLYYVDMRSIITGINKYGKAVNILSGWGLHKRYDYIGLIKDRAYFDEITMSKIQAESHSGYDAIILPVAHILYDVYPQPPKEIYDNPVEFFRDYGALVTNWETVFFKYDSLLENVNWEDFISEFFVDGTNSFIQVIALFVGLAKIETPQIRVLREAEVIRYCSFLSSSTWYNQIFLVWAERWPRAVDMLPACYNEYKSLVKKQETMQPFLFGSPHKLVQLAKEGLLTPKVIGELKDVWPEISDIPYECLYDIVENRHDLLIRRLMVEWVKLFAEQKYPQAYHMFYSNMWLKDVLGDYSYATLKKCFEIYRIELEHGKEKGIFRNVYSYREAVENYQTMKYMLRRLEYDMADDVIDAIVPYFMEQSMTVEYLSFIIMTECADAEKVISCWERLSSIYQKEHQGGKL